jgi:hypothetical protein
MQNKTKVQLKERPPNKEIIVEESEQNIDIKEAPNKGLTFADLSPKLSNIVSDPDKLIGNQGADQCVENILEGVGQYPRSLFLNNVSGTAEIKLYIDHTKITLLQSQSGSPLVGHILCEDLKKRLSNFSGNNCFRSIYKRYGAQTLSMHLSLSVGSENTDEFIMIGNNQYLRHIQLMSKTAPARGLIIITNIFSAIDLIENSNDRVQWEKIQNDLRSNNCHRHEIFL